MQAKLEKIKTQVARLQWPDYRRVPIIPFHDCRRMHGPVIVLLLVLSPGYYSSILRCILFDASSRQTFRGVYAGVYANDKCADFEPRHMGVSSGKAIPTDSRASDHALHRFCY